MPSRLTVRTLSDEVLREIAGAPEKFAFAFYGDGALVPASESEAEPPKKEGLLSKIGGRRKKKSKKETARGLDVLIAYAAGLPEGIEFPEGWENPTARGLVDLESAADGLKVLVLGEGAGETTVFPLGLFDAFKDITEGVHTFKDGASWGIESAHIEALYTELDKLPLDELREKFDVAIMEANVPRSQWPTDQPQQYLNFLLDKFVKLKMLVEFALTRRLGLAFDRVEG